MLCQPKLLIIDEIGYLPLDRLGANLFFQLVSRRYERGSILITSNQSLTGWGQVFGDQVIATAILDRLLHHSTIVNIKGESYRLKEKRKAGLLARSEALTGAGRSPTRLRPPDRGPEVDRPPPPGIGTGPATQEKTPEAYGRWRFYGNPADAISTGLENRRQFSTAPTGPTAAIPTNLKTGKAERPSPIRGSDQTKAGSRGGNFNV